MSDPNSPYQPPTAHPQGNPQGTPQGAPQGYAQGYGPGPYGPGANASPGGAAKWAAILLLVLAGLYVLNAGLTMWQVSGTPLDEFMSQEDMQEMQAQGFSMDAIRGIMFGCVGACFGVLVITMLVLAAVVRKGGQAAAITALVIVGILGLLSVLSLLGAVAGLASGQVDTGQATIGLIYSLVELTVIGLLIVMLIRTIMQAGALKQYRMQQEMAQQQAAWQSYQQQPGGGYGQSQRGWGGQGPYDPPNG